MTPAEIARRFTFHPVGDDTNRAATHERVRAGGRALAELLVDLVPDGPELDAALLKVEEAVFWANAGVARPPATPPIRSITVRRDDITGLAFR